jgi:hypothetical protein
MPFLLSITVWFVLLIYHKHFPADYSKIYTPAAVKANFLPPCDYLEMEDKREIEAVPVEVE